MYVSDTYISVYSCIHMCIYVYILEARVLVVDETDKAPLEGVFLFKYTCIYICIYMYTCI